MKKENICVLDGFVVYQLNAYTWFLYQHVGFQTINLCCKGQGNLQITMVTYIVAFQLQSVLFLVIGSVACTYTHGLNSHIIQAARFVQLMSVHKTTYQVSQRLKWFEDQALSRPVCCLFLTGHAQSDSLKETVGKGGSGVCEKITHENIILGLLKGRQGDCLIKW